MRITIRSYMDMDLERSVKEGEILEVSGERARLLVSKRFATIIEITNLNTKKNAKAKGSHK